MTVRSVGERTIVVFAGDWDTDHLAPASTQLDRVGDPGPGPVTLDLRAVDALDTNGALLVHRTAQALAAGGRPVDLDVADPHHRTLLDAAARAPDEAGEIPREPNPLVVLLERTGRNTLGILATGRDLLSFLGAVTLALLASLARPHRIRWRALIAQMEQTGLYAVPIVGLLSFLIGIVLAYQSADQLARFGAQIFTVNIVAVGVLREMGVLITAIIVAGRSGSAFTAQIGTMKVNQEIDALETLGMSPVDVLVVPRVLGLILVMPLLTFYANLMGLLGGAVMSMMSLDIGFNQFLVQLQGAVDASTLFVGLVKAPLFAGIIAVVGCFEGMQVSQSAESVGQRTTRSVVESIFLVIVLDAMLSILFSVIGV
ncbi:MAG: ABC transporter permease [Alphaproteobacteria bacterium]